jgi:hypothetical protein
MSKQAENPTEFHVHGCARLSGGECNCWELPGFHAVQFGIHEQRWPHTMDAQAWVVEWMKRPAADRERIANDEGCMLAWFANAIMAGYDTAMYRASRDRFAEELRGTE